jgi:hypothetical protein
MGRWGGAVGLLVLGVVAIVIVLTGPASVQSVRAAGPRPSDGWTLHIDAKLHFPGKPGMLAHHYCEPVAGGLTECQLYDSDAADARLVGVEVIATPDLYKKFSKGEQAMWHYHTTEIPKVSATLPDLGREEAERVVKDVEDVEDTHGKIYLLWDPGKQALPTGRPTVKALK